jgi:hypothetical protein
MREKNVWTRSFGGGLVASLMVLSYGGLAACKKKEVPRPAPETTTTSPMSPIPAPPSAPAGIQFSELRVGKAVNADKSVTVDVETFAPADTIYASVATTGTGVSTPIRALWTYQDGQVVSDDVQTISGTGSDRTEFHISKPDGFPAGGYKVEIFIDGRSVMNRNFNVR